MRCALLTLWAALSVALAAAACANACTERLAALGVLPTAIPDVHHESLLPTAVAALFCIASLAFTLLFCRIGPDDPFARLHRSPMARGAFVALTAALTLAVLVAMETYEMRFGGLSVFDAHSVVASHLGSVLAAYAACVVLVDRGLRHGLAVASRAVVAFARALDRFARRRFGARLRLARGGRRAPAIRSRLAWEIRGLRAPPSDAAPACVRWRRPWYLSGVEP